MSRIGFLRAVRSFLVEVTRMFDVAPRPSDYGYHFPSDPAKADALAIARDWEVVGHDMRIAIGQFKKEVQST